MAINFDKYAQEGNLFVKNLAEKLGHPNEVARTGILLRAVLHTLRDRITIGESLNMMAQLPMFLKAVYVEDWKYSEQPTKISTMEEFSEEVEKHQEQYGEQEFSWKKSTEELVQIILGELATYISQGEFEDIKSQLPEGLYALFEESIHS